MKKLLVLTHSAGFVHSYLPVAEETIKKLGEKSGQFEVDVTKDCTLINSETLKNYDAILFATTGELPMNNEQKKALIDFVKVEGKGFIGVHNATDTFYKFAEYGEMVGGYFSGHPWTQEVGVIVVDSDHVSTKHLPPSFKTREEVYTHRNWSADRTHVLLKLDNETVDLSRGNRDDNYYALAWCHEYGKGRVFYTAFGHFEAVWSEEWFQKHLLNGILWAMKSV